METVNDLCSVIYRLYGGWRLPEQEQSAKNIKFTRYTNSDHFDTAIHKDLQVTARQFNEWLADLKARFEDLVKWVMDVHGSWPTQDELNNNPAFNNVYPSCMSLAYCDALEKAVAYDHTGGNHWEYDPRAEYTSLGADEAYFREEIAYNEQDVTCPVCKQAARIPFYGIREAELRGWITCSASQLWPRCSFSSPSHCCYDNTCKFRPYA